MTASDGWFSFFLAFSYIRPDAVPKGAYYWSIIAEKYTPIEMQYPAPPLLPSPHRHNNLTQVFRVTLIIFPRVCFQIMLGPKLTRMILII